MHVAAVAVAGQGLHTCCPCLPACLQATTLISHRSSATAAACCSPTRGAHRAWSARYATSSHRQASQHALCQAAAGQPLHVGADTASSTTTHAAAVQVPGLSLRLVLCVWVSCAGACVRSCKLWGVQPHADVSAGGTVCQVRRVPLCDARQPASQLGRHRQRRPAAASCAAKDADARRGEPANPGRARQRGEPQLIKCYRGGQAATLQMNPQERAAAAAGAAPAHLPDRPTTSDQ